MTALIIDTHAYVKKLVTAGMPEAQAEVIANEQTRLIDEHLATKRDLKDTEVLLRADLKEMEVLLRADLKELEVLLRADLKHVEQSILIKMGAMLLALGGFLAGIKFFA